MKAYRRFKQFGGWRLLLTYWRMGIFFGLCKDVSIHLIKRRPLKNAYYLVERKVMPILGKQYGRLIRQGMEKYKPSEVAVENPSTYIWFCWMQGIENAPEMVRHCYTSLKSNIPDKDITVITSQNYKEWCNLPDYIIEKYRKGYIPHVAFSDLLRLELIYEHGGSWIDASVFCSGWKDRPQLKEWAYKVLNANLFMPRYTLRDGGFAGTSNWFITAQKNSAAIATLRDVLYSYWKDYDCVVDYYIMHRFFSGIVQKYPDVLEQMEVGYSRPMLQLGKMIADVYDEEFFSNLTNNVCFHKMNYRHESIAKKNPESYYNRVILH